MSRIGQQEPEHEWDELLVWLTGLLSHMEKWMHNGRGSGAFHHLAQYDRFAYEVESRASLLNWNTADRESKDRTMKWIPVGEACHDFVGELERWRELTDQDWRENMTNVQAAIDWFQKHNPPKSLPDKH